MIQFGIGQSEGKDRSGLTPLLASIATCDPNGILCGSSVTNVMLDQKLIRDDELFEKTVLMMETYFRQGGIHFQLNYVSPEELKETRLCPQKYKSLRVRVSGFSDYFVALDGDLQDEIVTRTEHAQ
ncbi:MAG: glycine radical domain-containing protein [Eubacteriales bacterium]|nr:glycine radical domain-containing protein [Eubacteriales bacterium]